MSSETRESHIGANPSPATNSQPTPDRTGVIAGISAYLLWGFITVYWKALNAFAPLELIGYRIV
ncbi:MAG: hypothetical protein O3B91_10840, partial [Actinomycetota bacterium]|nr:hypothetical protein [Actinomycetota bacterium]